MGRGTISVRDRMRRGGRQALPTGEGFRERLRRTLGCVLDVPAHLTTQGIRRGLTVFTQRVEYLKEEPRRESVRQIIRGDRGAATSRR